MGNLESLVHRVRRAIQARKAQTDCQDHMGPRVQGDHRDSPVLATIVHRRELALEGTPEAAITRKDDMLAEMHDQMLAKSSNVVE